MRHRRVFILTPGFVSAGLALIMDAQIDNLEIIANDNGILQLEQQQLIDSLSRQGLTINKTYEPDFEQRMRERAQQGYKFDIPTPSRPWLMHDCVVRPIYRFVTGEGTRKTMDPTELITPAKTAYERELFFQGAPRQAKRVRYRFPIADGKIRKKECIEMARKNGIDNAREVPLTRTGFWADPWRKQSGWKKLYQHRPEKFRKAVYWEKNSATDWHKNKQLTELREEVKK